MPGIVVRAGLAALVAAAAIPAGCTKSGRSRRASQGLNNQADAGADTAGAAPAPTPSASQIGGQWSGIFTDPVNGTRQSLRAEIRQDGDRVAIETTLPGVGAFFTGTIDANGNLTLTDAWDGENWTTREQPATRSRIVIQDVIPEPDNGALVLYNTIELSR